MDSGAAASDVVAFSEEHTRTEHIALSEGGAVRAEPLPPLGAKRAREEAGNAAKGPCAKRAAGDTAAAGKARETHGDEPLPDFTSYFMDDGSIQVPMRQVLDVQDEICVSRGSL